MSLAHLLIVLSPAGAAFALFRVEHARRSLGQSRRRVERYAEELATWEASHDRVD